MHDLLLSAVLLAAPLGAADSDVTMPTQEPTVAWTRLEMSATKLFFTATSEVELEELPTAEVREALLPAFEGEALVPTAPTCRLMTLRSSFLGRDSEYRLWFEGGDGRALQRVNVDSGKRQRYKSYRFSATGVAIERRYPAQGEEEMPPGAWSQATQELTAYDGLEPDAVVTEPSALFYLLATAPLAAPGDSLRLLAFSRERVFAVEVRVEEKTQLPLSYVEERAGEERKVEGPVTALRLAVEPEAGEGAEAEGFQLLGLEGAMDLYLEPVHRMPLQVSGKLGGAGRVHVKLRRVVLR